MKTNTVYILPQEGPPCPTHGGHMKLNFQADRYDCLGFDGEGCEYKVSCEEFLVEIGTFGSGPDRV